MDENLARFLGAYLAAGRVTEKTWSLTIGHQTRSALEPLKELVSTLFGIEARVADFPGKRPGLVVSSKALVEFIRYLGAGDLGADHQIPSAVLTSPRPIVLAYLQGLTLGALDMLDGTPCICLASPIAAAQLQVLEANLGWATTRSECVNPRTRRPATQLNLEPSVVDAFLAEVGFLDQENADRMTEALKVRSELPAAHWFPRRWEELSITPMPAGYVDELRFTPVISNDDAGIQAVYDLSVPGSHSFSGNGVINHNTVNLPKEATVSDIRDCYELAYALGVKCVAVYRDGSKLSQVLTSQKAAEDPLEPAALREILPGTSPTAFYHGTTPPKFKLPETCYGLRWKLNVGGTEVFLRTGQYPDGTLGEIFVDLSKEGSTLKGFLTCFAIAVSHGLQYGVPLEKLVEVFTFHNFAPQGMVSGHPNVKMASSIVDAIFKVLAFHYLGREDLVQVPTPKPLRIAVDPVHRSVSGFVDTEVLLAPVVTAAAALSEEVPQAPASPAGTSLSARIEQTSGEVCGSCGGQLVRSGTCKRCLNCGDTTGCS